jgi:putative mycofactocin binding protein MftB
MACAASTDPLGASLDVGLDLDRAYELDPRVALRPERFGALAYHYGNRRLTFLRSSQLVDLLHSLAHHPTAGDAMTAVGIRTEQRPGIVRALTSLIRSEMIRAR